MDNVIVIKVILDYHVNLDIVLIIVIVMGSVTMANAFANLILKVKIVHLTNVLIHVLIKENV